MPVRLLPVGFLVAMISGGLMSPGSPAADPPAAPHDLVFVQKGTLPVIVSVPHGGRKPIPDVPERVGLGVKKFATDRDENTAEMAEKFVAALEKKLGGKPWVVIARFERKYADVNRPRDAAYESDKARPYYDAYHDALTAACKAVQKRHRRGLLLDVHGQGLIPEAICRGTRNGQTVKLLKERFGWPAVVGRRSVLGQMERSDYKVVPACDADEATKEEPNFSGGHIIDTYGSHTGYAIDAIMLEFGTHARDRDAYPKTAKDLADAVAVFHDEYLKD
jgi:N-formylglutamate amidohydrolase